MARDQNALPKGALSRLGTLRFRHGDHVKCIAYSPDGTKFVSGGGADDPTISVWDVKTGKELKRLEAHKNCITALAFSSDGKLVVSGDADGTVVVSNLATGDQLSCLEAHEHDVTCLAFHSSSMVASGGVDGTIRLWRFGKDARPRVIKRFQTEILSLCVLLNGKRLGVGGGNCPGTVIDVGTGRQIWCSKRQYGVTCARFSPDGKYLAWSIMKKSIHLQEVDSPEREPITCGNKEWVRTLSFSHDGKLLVTGSDTGSLRIFDTSELKQVRCISILGSIYSVSLPTDGKTIASAVGCTTRFWDAQTGKELGDQTGPSDCLLTVAFSPDGKLVAGGGMDRVGRVWEIGTGRELLRLIGHQDSILRIEFSPCGKRLASSSSDGTIRLWEVATGKEAKRLVVQNSSDFAFSRDGRYLAAEQDKGEIVVYDLTRGAIHSRLVGCKEWVSSITFTGNSRTLVIGRRGGGVEWWDVTSGKKTHGGKLSGAEIDAAVAVGKEKMLVLADGLIQRMRMTGECKDPPLLRPGGRVRRGCFSADGGVFAGVLRDQTIQAWNIQANKELCQLKGHRGVVCALAISVDGKMLVSGGSDTTLLLWTLPSAQGR
jgi:WD40 repeat protein